MNLRLVAVVLGLAFAGSSLAGEGFGTSESWRRGSQYDRYQYDPRSPYPQHRGAPSEDWRGYRPQPGFRYYERDRYDRDDRRERGEHRENHWRDRDYHEGYRRYPPVYYPYPAPYYDRPRPYDGPVIRFYLK